jgi:hypothetical protein
MAEKRSRGLPDGFALNTAEDLPVSLGDFLDEEDETKNVVLARKLQPPAKEVLSPTPPPVLTQGIASPAPEVRQFREPAPPSPPPVRPVVAVPPPPEVSAPPPEEKKSSLHPAWKRPRRKQLNVSAEAERMLEALLRQFQQYGPQEDIKMSELFEALILIAYESRDKLNLGVLPRRGAWGSQTEKNFPIAIAEAFARAIAEERSKWREVSNG